MKTLKYLGISSGVALNVAIICFISWLEYQQIQTEGFSARHFGRTLTLIGCATYFISLYLIAVLNPSLARKIHNQKPVFVGIWVKGIVLASLVVLLR